MPERMSRWLWLIKWLLLFPHYVILAFLGFLFWILLIVAWVVIVITAKYPRGLFDLILGISRWITRAAGYLTLLTDKYPPFSTSEEPGYPIRVSVPYPERSSRLTVFFRWLLAIPHFIIGGALGYLQWALVLIHAVILLFTGKPNREIFRILVGISRWNVRVQQYSYFTTDRYPPFSFD
jgi:hypothetical protein